jgi:hypothetical protein
MEEIQRLWRNGDLREVERVCRSAIDAGEVEPGTHLTLALCLLEQQQFQEAEALLESFRDAHPRSVEARTIEFYVSLWKGDDASCQRVLEENGESGVVDPLQGVYLYAKGDYVNAAKSLEACLTSADDWQMDWVGKMYAMSLARTGDSAAAAAFLQAGGQDYELVVQEFRLQELAFQQDAAQLRLELEKLSAEDNNRVQVKAVWAELFLLENRLEQPEGMFREAAKQNLRYKLELIRVAAAYFDSGELDRADAVASELKDNVHVGFYANSVRLRVSLKRRRLAEAAQRLWQQSEPGSPTRKAYEEWLARRNRGGALLVFR